MPKSARIQFTCPHCGKSLHASRRAAKQTLQCPNRACRLLVLVPKASEKTASESTRVKSKSASIALHQSTLVWAFAIGLVLFLSTIIMVTSSTANSAPLTAKQHFKTTYDRTSARLAPTGTGPAQLTLHRSPALRALMRAGASSAIRSDRPVKKDSPEAILSQLEKARTKYDQDMKSFRESLLATLGIKEKAAKRRGDTTQLQQLVTEKHALEARSEIPVRLISKATLARMANLYSKLDRAYDRAVKTCLRTKSEPTLLVVEAERDRTRSEFHKTYASAKERLYRANPRKYLLGKTWQFGEVDGAPLIARLTFGSSGRVYGAKHPNERRWRLQGPTIVLARPDHVKSTVFDQLDVREGRLILTGPHQFDRSRRFFLREIND